MSSWCFCYWGWRAWEGGLSFGRSPAVDAERTRAQAPSLHAGAARRTGSERARERVGLGRLLPRCAPGAETRADPRRRTRGSAVLLPCADILLRTLAGGRARAAARDGRRSDLRRRG